ncbi:SDR family oxidoreductase [Geomonas nitrogeniifigens]|uniref:SDR family oxidoreductase n=1 Tax=Geomonas diazotrophica TaxID=2843197 RepID=A0ABX8JCT5_9BACT|nr:SDR family oxidoreductase [Geomonas nitrogeniifigens]QWV96123.1 SDR family oxidoreductase [Geomonas nitrogeniifigens]QXE85190.1 SDR family oxidoreductase [Geomonas nitrogeniifigens]
MIVITGATGQLGRLAIASLLKKVPASRIVAAVRNPDKAKDLSSLGVHVRQADYNSPETWASALAGAEKLLLISSSEVGQRVSQHRTVIEAAKKAGVKLLAYTSLLRADSSPLGLAAEHLATETLIRESSIPFVILRNGWYTENYAASIAPAVEHGSFYGSAGDGRIASAARADYAEAAVAVLTTEGHRGRVYELAGDTTYTLTEFAAEISRQYGKPVNYVNLPELEYKQLLVSVGLPEPLAALLADSDSGAAKGGLFDGSRQLSSLIGRPTTSLEAVIAKGKAGV